MTSDTRTEPEVLIDADDPVEIRSVRAEMEDMLDIVDDLIVHLHEAKAMPLSSNALVDRELFLGKLVGTVLVAITLSGIYLTAIFAVTRHLGIAHMIEPAIYPWFFLFLVLALFMYGSMFSAIGAVMSMTSASSGPTASFSM